MNALILAAGFGTRLLPLTSEIPKCMLPVGGLPILLHTINLLRNWGIENVMVNLHHLPTVVTEFFGESGEKYGIKLNYFREEKLLGTAGSIRAISKESDFLDSPYLLIYGDTLTNLNLHLLIERHKKSTTPHVTMSLWKPSRTRDYGVTILQGDRVIEFIEKPLEEYLAGFANAGVMIVDPEFNDLICDDDIDLSTDVFPRVLRGQFPINGWLIPLNTFHTEIGTPAKYKEAVSVFDKTVPHGFMFDSHPTFI